MRNRYNSSNNNNSIMMPTIQTNLNYTQQKLNTNQNYRTKNKYQPRTPPIIEIYDLEALELDISSSLSSSSSSNELYQINSMKHKNSQYSSPMSSASSSPRSSFETSSLHQSDSSYSDEPFTFQGT